MKEIIKTDNAPQAIGPYSQAIAVGNLVFASGQLYFDPAAGELIQGTIQEKTVQCLKNAEAILKEAGSDLSKAVKTTVYLSDMSLFGAMNEAYAGFFPENPPARSCVAVKELPRGAEVEIEVIAYR